MTQVTQLELPYLDEKERDVIEAQRHPKRYESHKYWGRKPSNIVSQYISHFTKKGDLVLDPFCGSGVTVFEALAIGRNAVGYDLNPIACFIAESLLSKDVNLSSLEKCGNDIIEQIEQEFPYYDVKCDCGQIGNLINGIWRDGNYIAKYYFCPQCGHRMSDTTDFDRQQVENIVVPESLWYPKDKLPRDADAEYVHELFTTRNLMALSLLLREIRKVTDETTRNLLLYTFTSNLAFASIIIPVNEKRFKQGRNCTGIWGFKRFWIPSFHVENNVFKYFRNRLNRTIIAKNETNELLRNNEANAKLINHSSTSMNELPSESVDFIFTDPPFGNMVPYLNLSTLWNAWLQFDVQTKDEIIIDQQHSEEDYSYKLTLVFKECHRVLRNDGFLVVTFNNKSMKVWRILLESIHNAHFSLQECLPAEDGEVSFTQTTKSAKGSLRGHFVYVFKKSEKVSGFGETCFDEAITKVELELMGFIDGTPKSITEIYNHIIPFMVNNDLLHSDFADDVVEQILAKRGKLITQKQNRVIEGEMVELKSYSWVSR